MWLPEKYKKPNTSTYVQGVEVETDYMGMVPEGFDTIRLPEAEYLMFQGQPFREEDYCEAIRTVQAAMDSYDPSIVGCRWATRTLVSSLNPVAGAAISSCGQSGGFRNERSCFCRRTDQNL